MTHGKFNCDGWMPPARYGARIHVEWEPFDPARLMVMVAGAIQERRL